MFGNRKESNDVGDFGPPHDRIRVSCVQIARLQKLVVAQSNELAIRRPVLPEMVTSGS
jgi:hypothetical protein